jgi:hypothetical protein
LFTGGHGNLELVAPEGSNLVHSHRDDVSRQWAQGLPANAAGPGGLIRSDFGSGRFHHFEAPAPGGSNLVHYYWDNVLPAVDAS